MKAAWNNIKKRVNMKMFLRVFMIVLSVCLLSACEERECDIGLIQADAKECWSCPIFELFFQTATSVYTEIQSRSAPTAYTVIAVAFALWLAIRIMRQIASLKELDIYSFWNDLAVRAFWAAMCAALTSNINQITDDLIFPVWSGFIDFGIMVVGKLPVEGGNVSCGTGDPATGMSCLISAIHTKLAEGREMGYVLMTCNTESVILNMYGAGIYIVSVVLGFLFPIFMLDGVFRFAVIMALMPLWICAFCFPISRGLASKAWTSFLGVCLQGAAMAVFAALCVWCLQAFIAHKFPTVKNAMALATDTKTAQQVADGPGIVIFIFIAFFLLLFGKVLMNLFSMNFCDGGTGTTAGSALKQAGTFVKNVGKVAADRVKKHQNKNMAREYEKMRQNGGVKSKEQAKRAAKLEQKMMKRGMMEMDKSGNLKTTNKYANSLKNSVGRDAARAVYRAAGGKGDSFKDWSIDHKPDAGIKNMHGKEV